MIWLKPLFHVCRLGPGEVESLSTIPQLWLETVLWLKAPCCFHACSLLGLQKHTMRTMEIISCDWGQFRATRTFNKYCILCFPCCFHVANRKRVFLLNRWGSWDLEELVTCPKSRIPTPSSWWVVFLLHNTVFWYYYIPKIPEIYHPKKTKEEHFQNILKTEAETRLNCIQI